MIPEFGTVYGPRGFQQLLPELLAAKRAKLTETGRVGLRAARCVEKTMRHLSVSRIALSVDKSRWPREWPDVDDRP